MDELIQHPTPTNTSLDSPRDHQLGASLSTDRTALDWGSCAVGAIWQELAPAVTDTSASLSMNRDATRRCRPSTVTVCDVTIVWRGSCFEENSHDLSRLEGC